MADATGEANKALRVAFDRRLKLEFHGARITSDAGLLAYRELDDALGLTAVAAPTLAEGRRGKNIRHRLLGLLRQADDEGAPVTLSVLKGNPARRLYESLGFIPVEETDLEIEMRYEPAPPAGGPGCGRCWFR